MMFRAALLIALLAAAPAIASDALPPPATLADTDWVLSNLDGKAVESPRLPSLKLTAGGAMAGFAGCNSYFGLLVFRDGGAVSASGIGSTRMACPPTAMALEAAFLRALSGVSGWRLSGGVLTFEGSGGTIGFKGP